MSHSYSARICPEEHAGGRVGGHIRHRLVAHAGRQHRPSTNFTLGHAGRQVRVGPVAFWTIVGTLVIMALWSVATATYFAFRDDLLTRLVARQAQMQYAYEDRIAELRAQIDRLTSRQLLDQEQFERRLDQLVRRQSALESNAVELMGIAESLPTGAARPPRSNAGDVRPTAPRPAPISDKVILLAPSGREAQLHSRAPSDSLRRVATPNGDGRLAARIATLEIALDRTEASQATVLTRIEERLENRARRIREVLAELGVDVAGLGHNRPAGGPFVPVIAHADAGSLERRLRRVRLVRAQLERLREALTTVPVGKPLAGEIDTTSGFGVRLDPFLRAPAMHTGLDFRGSPGDPVHATAAGTVTQVGWNGGYGRMVEIDHGNGLATRYAHLSAIEVAEGQAVQVGQVVGRVGSTGRSTGPHLHYETRIDGEPVDPQKFLRAAIRLGERL